MSSLNIYKIRNFANDSLDNNIETIEKLKTCAKEIVEQHGKQCGTLFTMQANENDYFTTVPVYDAERGLYEVCKVNQVCYDSSENEIRIDGENVDGYFAIMDGTYTDTINLWADIVLTIANYVE